MSDITAIKAEVSRLKTKYDEKLKTPWQLGRPAPHWLQMTINLWIGPCAAAMEVADDAIAEEVKNILDLHEFPGRGGRKTNMRKICWLSECTCHLRLLNALVAQKKGYEMVTLEAQIAATEDARHAAHNLCVAAQKVWDDAQFEKRIAMEALEEAKWESGMILISEWEAEMRALNSRVMETRGAERAAAEAYATVHKTTAAPLAEWNRLIAIKKGLSTT